MAQMQNAPSVALQIEKVRDKLPLLYERDDILLTMIRQRGDVERVSSRNMRLPLQIRPGGEVGLANMDGGDLGRGSGTMYDVFLCEGEEPSDAELARARGEVIHHTLVAEADVMWARGHSFREISDLHRRAAIALGLERE
jgi:hypothetical protein